MKQFLFVVLIFTSKLFCKLFIYGVVVGAEMIRLVNAFLISDWTERFRDLKNGHYARMGERFEGS